MYLAEGTAHRAPPADKSFVSVRGWAQTAAIGVALRNAGFGLQFDLAGEDVVETMTEGQLPAAMQSAQAKPEGAGQAQNTSTAPATELTPEEKLKQASMMPCPIGKYNGRTLGDMIMLDPAALKWIAEKYTGDETVKAGAKYLCDYAIGKTAA